MNSHAVRSEMGVQLGEVHLIRRGTLPKTSSGKVRRKETKRRIEVGELELVTDADVESAGPSTPLSAGLLGNRCLISGSH